jgi:CheY-like chemotaxis protein
MLKVLLVEDDADARDALALLLLDSGYELAIAGDGDTAVATAAEFNPDVIVCDWLLPGVDGVTAARAIQSDQLHPAPVIFVTAHSIADLRSRTRDLNVRAYLSKPVDFMRLRNELAALEH